MAGDAAVDIAPYVEGLFLSLLGQDWQQSRKMTRDPVRYREENPLYGEHPSQSKIDAGMALSGALHLAGYNALPEKYRLPYALASALIEGKVVNDNRKQGLGINKPALAAGALMTLYLASRNKEGKEKKWAFYPDTIEGAPGGRVNFYW